MAVWQMKTKGSLKYITVPAWDRAGVRTAFSTRQGGSSPDPYASLNLGLHVGDQKENVIANRTLLLAGLGARAADMVCCEQVHGAEVARVGAGEAGCGAFDLSTAIAGCDAMICNEPGVNLAAFFADCFPVYIFDPRRRVVALAHAGWKGTMQRIAARTVGAMTEHYGCRVQDMEVFIGPGIGPCCFEIGHEVAQKVKAELPGRDLLRNENGRLTWDLARTNFRLLEEIGISADQIDICGLCTACHRDLFFSYRRDSGLTGRMAAVIALQE